MLAARKVAIAGLVGMGLLFGACDRAERDTADSEPPPVSETPLAPGYGPLGFEAPRPGSYALPPLGPAADGRVLASDGSQLALHDLLDDKVAILSLMYASCSDVNGCPLAMAVLHQVASRMEKDPELAAGLRLLSLSFDPARDTPDVMARVASHHVGHAAGPGVDWQFLTTASPDDLAPILEGYGQSLVAEFDEAGDPLGQFSHILRVFLIDPARRIRNIYSVSYLHADTLIADVETLLMERARPAAVAAHSRDAAPPGGEPIDLLARASRPPLGLPELAAPPDNPPSPEKVALGRKLFFDRRLSLNATLSCAMCHVPEQGFASNELATAVGIEGRTVRRNTPTVLNVGFSSVLFHDGRESRLEHQIWGPLLARNEMGNASVGSLIERIRGLDDYAARFERAFPGRGLAIETLGMAIASYERTLVAGDSAFDRWYFAREADALDERAVRGYELFAGKAGCVGCHTIGAKSALLSDDRLHNTGIGYRASMLDEGATRRVQIAPGEVVSVDTALIAEVAEPTPDDLGLYEVTQDPDDRWKYKTPSLRNVALTAPYMHDGSLATLRDVVEYYARGGVPNAGLDARIRPLDLSPGEIGSLVAFLESLTGDVGPLVADARAAPVGDVGEVVALDAARSRSEVR